MTTHEVHKYVFVRFGGLTVYRLSGNVKIIYPSSNIFDVNSTSNVCNRLSPVSINTYLSVVLFVS